MHVLTGPELAVQQQTYTFNDFVVVGNISMFSLKVMLNSLQ